MQDVRDLREDDDVPLFLHVPKASGTTAKEILLDCYGLIRTEVIQLPSSLEVITEGGGGPGRRPERPRCNRDRPEERHGRPRARGRLRVAVRT